jgi:hypothetical protein
MISEAMNGRAGSCFLRCFQILIESVHLTGNEAALTLFVIP